MERVGLHTMTYLREPARVSTVKLADGVYETIVMWDDGEEIESPVRTATLEDARALHNETMRRWNDRLYEGSIDKLLGFANLGQFVKPVKMC